MNLGSNFGMPGVNAPFPGAVGGGVPYLGMNQGFPSTNFGGMGMSGFPPGIGGLPYQGGILGGGVDLDPISPGVQSNLGVISATGPAQLYGGQGFGGISGSQFGSSAFIGGMGASGRFMGGMGAVDLDPITPGIQSQPGVVTPMGPPQIVGNIGMGGMGGLGGLGGMGGMGVMGGMGQIGSSGYNANTMTSGRFGGMGMGMSGMNVGMSQGILGAGGVDLDPITPGIQTQPGVVVQTGPSQVVGNVGIGGLGSIQPQMTGSISYGYNQNAGMINSGIAATQFQQQGSIVGGIGGMDLDPVTPGYQNQAGLVTQTGPSVIVGRVGGGFCVGCPWWLWPLLGLLLLAALLGGLYACFRRRSSSSQDDDDQETDESSRKSDRTVVSSSCRNGYKNANGQCITCPSGSEWNGRSCSYQQSTDVSNNQKTIVNSVDGETPNGNDLSETIAASKSEVSVSSSKTQTIPVFENQEGEQAINSALQNRVSNEGTQPDVVTSQPIRMKPNVQVGAGTGKQTQSGDSISNNVVSVNPIVQKKSTPPVIGGTSSYFGCSNCRTTPYIGYANTGSYGSTQSTGKTTSSSTKKVVVRKVSYKNEVVAPIESDPGHRHFRRPQ